MHFVHAPRNNLRAPHYFTFFFNAFFPSRIQCIASFMWSVNNTKSIALCVLCACMLLEEVLENSSVNERLENETIINLEYFKIWACDMWVTWCDLFGTCDCALNFGGKKTRKKTLNESHLILTDIRFYKCKIIIVSIVIFP